MKFATRRMRGPLLKEFKHDQYGLRRIPHGEINSFIDIGANIGLVSLYAKLLHMPIKVYSFEPHMKSFECLKSNTAGMSIDCYREALGDGSFIVMTNTSANTNNTTILMEDNTPGSIQSKSLSTLIDLYKIPIGERTMLKIDCEGGEWSLQNSNDVEIMRKVGVIAMEIHSPEGKNKKPIYDYIIWLKNTFTEFTVRSCVKGQGHVIMYKEPFNDYLGER